MEYTTSNQRLKVPLKLLHINETLYTDEWMKLTYKYHHFFQESLNETRPQEGENNLQQWKTKAILMTHEIKQKGMIAGRRELCRVAKEEYGLTIPGPLQRKNTEFGRKIAFTEILQSAIRMLKKKLYLEFTEILQ